jgi:hypothetical protein
LLPLPLAYLVYQLIYTVFNVVKSAVYF